MQSVSSDVILIVDDEEVAREGLLLALEDQGYTLLCAGEGREALSIVEKADPPVDIILTDIKMPDMDGLQLLAAVKEKHKGIEVVMITGFATVDTAVEAWKRGAFDYVSKPYRLDEVRMTIKRALDKRRRNKGPEPPVPGDDSPDIIAESEKMRNILDLVDKVAPSRSNILITGESGVGKELIARSIHARSPRADLRFLAFNCAARAESLLESELFGNEKGAFTGADKTRYGIFEAAAGGTVFLDEIAEIPPPLQVKLLRVIQQRKVIRLGGCEEINVDFRLVAATNRELSEEIKSGRFREDLYYRLNVITIEVPPLRRRRSDILPLARHFLGHFAAREGKSFSGFSADAEDRLVSLDWPGNVRELQNIVERAVILSSDDRIGIDDLPPLKQAEGKEDNPEDMVCLAIHEKRYILEVIKRVGGNRSRAARILGMDRSSLWRKLKAFEQEDKD